MPFLDLLFPKFCIGCSARRSYLCTKCIQKVPFSTTSCPSCGRFSIYGKTHAQCTSRQSLAGIIPIWEYRGVIKQAIVALKYKFAFDIANELVKSATVELQKFKIPRNATITAVPIHTYRENWRGFNHAGVLAQKLSTNLQGNYVSDLLIKKEASIPQVQLKKTKRLRNMRGKVAVNTTRLATIDKNIPLYVVDDVWTTGATLKECAKVLKEAGFREVYAITLAKA